MAAWFGHTQTVATISKSVSTVAGGLIGLERNLTDFMKKVIYYEKFFQRRSEQLPPEINYAVSRLIRLCYEYRDAIREELESSVAYVADAGRWVVGLEDWNTKMDKRLAQLTEVVVLANSLLMEYAITGKVGPQGATGELSAYIGVLTRTISLDTDVSTVEINPDLKVVKRKPNESEVESKVVIEEIPESSCLSDDESSNPFCSDISPCHSSILEVETDSMDQINCDSRISDGVAKESNVKQSIPKQSIPEKSISKQSIPEQSIPKQSIPKQSIPKQSLPIDSLNKEKVPLNGLGQHTVLSNDGGHGDTCNRETNDADPESDLGNNDEDDQYNPFIETNNTNSHLNACDIVGGNENWDLLDSDCLPKRINRDKPSFLDKKE